MGKGKRKNRPNARPAESTHPRDARSTAKRAAASRTRTAARRVDGDPDAAPSAPAVELDYGSSELNPILLDDDDDDDDGDEERDPVGTRQQLHEDGHDDGHAEEEAEEEEEDSDRAPRSSFSAQTLHTKRPDQEKLEKVQPGPIEPEEQEQQSKARAQDHEEERGGKEGEDGRRTGELRLSDPAGVDPASMDPTIAGSHSDAEREEGEVSDNEAKHERNDEHIRPFMSLVDDPRPLVGSASTSALSPLPARLSDEAIPEGAQGPTHFAYSGATPSQYTEGSAGSALAASSSSRYARPPYEHKLGAQWNADPRLPFPSEDRHPYEWRAAELEGYPPPHYLAYSYEGPPYGYETPALPFEQRSGANPPPPIPSSSRAQLSPWAAPYHPREPYYPSENGLHGSDPWDMQPTARNRKRKARESRDGAESPAKLLKRKPLRSQASAANYSAGQPGPMLDEAGPAASKEWLDKANQEAFELIAKLASRGMPPRALIAKGVDASIVQGCCDELGIPLDGPAATRTESSMSSTTAKGIDGSATGRQAETPPPSTRTAPAGTSVAGGPDSSLALRQAALATLRRKVIASQGARIKDPVEPNSRAEDGAVQQLSDAGRHGMPHDEQSMTLDEAKGRPTGLDVEPANGHAACESQGEELLTSQGGTRSVSEEEVEMVIDTSESEVDPAEPKQRRPRGYRDVDAPPGTSVVELGFGQENLPPTRRQQISYADAFSKRPDTPAGEVNLDTPLPTLAPTHTNGMHYANPASIADLDGSLLLNFAASNGPSQHIPSLWTPQTYASDTAAEGQRRRRPVAADFDAPTGYVGSLARKAPLVRQPYRTKLVIEVSDEESDSDAAEEDSVIEGSGDPVSTVVSRAEIRRQTTESIYALYLQQNGLTPSSNVVSPRLVPTSRTPLFNNASHGNPSPTRREGSQPAMATPKADASNEELQKKEQDIKLLLQRIKALERKKSSIGDTSAPSSGLNQVYADAGAGSQQIDSNGAVVTTARADGVEARSSEPADDLVPTDAGTGARKLQLDPQLRLQRERLLLALRQKKAAAEAEKRAAGDTDKTSPQQAEAGMAPSPPNEELRASDASETSEETAEPSLPVLPSENSPSQPSNDGEPPAAQTSSLLQNMTERFKSYISPLARFSGFRPFGGIQRTAAPGASSASTLTSEEESGPSVPVKKRWCPTEARGATCETETCRMAHARDYANAAAVDSADEQAESG